MGQEDLASESLSQNVCAHTHGVGVRDAGSALSAGALPSY